MEKTRGTFIYVILGVELTVKESYFYDGLAMLGGAIYIEGQSNIFCESIKIYNSMSKDYGGAIYATGFTNLKFNGTNQLINNYAYKAGDDIYVSNTEGVLSLSGLRIENLNAKSSIYVETASLYSDGLVMENVGLSGESAKGAGIQCWNCRDIKVYNSTFRNMVGQLGGAMYIREDEINKSEEKDGEDKYLIKGSVFESISAISGAAIFASNPHYLLI